MPTFQKYVLKIQLNIHKYVLFQASIINKIHR